MFEFNCTWYEFLMEICSHYAHHDQAVKEGRWEHNDDWCFWDYPMIELYGKTAGIIGLGRIGQATARILNALDMKVLANDKFESESGRKVAEYVDRDTLLKEIGCYLPALPAFPGYGRDHQQGEHCENEGRGDPHQ